MDYKNLRISILEFYYVIKLINEDPDILTITDLFCSILEAAVSFFLSINRSHLIKQKCLKMSFFSHP